MFWASLDPRSLRAILRHFFRSQVAGQRGTMGPDRLRRSCVRECKLADSLDHPSQSMQALSLTLSSRSRGATERQACVLALGERAHAITSPRCRVPRRRRPQGRPDAHLSGRDLRRYGVVSFNAAG
jgi:hypothetical protein